MTNYQIKHSILMTFCFLIGRRIGKFKFWSTHTHTHTHTHSGSQVIESNFHFHLTIDDIITMRFLQFTLLCRASLINLCYFTYRIQDVQTPRDFHLPLGGHARVNGGIWFPEHLGNLFFL